MAIYISVASIEFMITNHGRVLYENEQNEFACDTLMPTMPQMLNINIPAYMLNVINESVSTYYVQRILYNNADALMPNQYRRLYFIYKLLSF